MATAPRSLRDGYAARQFKRHFNAGMIGINVGVPAPMAWFPFTGWNQSFFGDLHIQGTESVQFYTQQKMTLTRWFASSSRFASGPRLENRTQQVVQRQDLILGLAVVDLAKDPAATGSLATSTTPIPGVDAAPVQRQDLILGLAVVDLAKDPAATGSLATSTTANPDPFRSQSTRVVRSGS